MTGSEAVEKLKNMRLFMQIEDENNDCKFTEDDYKANEMSIQALEKQIPKKIEIRKATNDDIESELRDFITVKGRICRCPSCRCCIHISKLKYCWECGQRLDFGDDEK